jgi:SpoVK/Ycf46/Vps4 family AAA+-type ATPase
MSGLGKLINPSDFKIADLKEASSNSHSLSTRSDTQESDAKPRLYSGRRPLYKLKDIILCDSAQHEINRLRSLIENQRLIFHVWGFDKVDPAAKKVAVNFYGPPGTGKTMCADALAAELGKNLIDVNYADLESKYVGDTPKNIVAAFDTAKATDSVLFFDEADSVLGRRLTSVTQSADHGVNASRSVMLKQMDNFAGVVVFATNLAENFDRAFVRRITQHIYIGPPNSACRLLLWKRFIPEGVPGRNTLDFGQLAEMSEGLCGGDIKNVCLLALCSAAARVGDQACLHQADLSEASAIVSSAKREIGRGETVR